MMLKVLVYGYSRQIWSSRQLAKAVSENIHFMWLAGGNTPDFRTLNRFRTDMKDVINEVFQLLMDYLVAKGLVKDSVFIKKQVILPV